jgi:hypothetical protein
VGPGVAESIPICISGCCSDGRVDVWRGGVPTAHLGREMYIGGGFLGTILVVLLIIYVAKRV